MPHKAPAITPYATPRCIDCPCKKNWNGRQDSRSAGRASCSILHSSQFSSVSHGFLPAFSLFSRAIFTGFGDIA
jgi:hypothetical protein